MISTSVDTTRIDEHDCELEQVGPDRGPRTKYRCTQCGTLVTPMDGVKKSKRNRKW